ncbi:MAG: hypothetical protein VW935_07880, partial [Novosphingobium sp.]
DHAIDIGAWQVLRLGKISRTDGQWCDIAERRLGPALPPEDSRSRQEQSAKTAKQTSNHADTPR